MADVHPTAVVEKGVELGEGTVVGPYAVIHAPCVVGPDNEIGAHAVIGGPPQARSHHRPGVQLATEGVLIGSRNVLREFVTVNQPTVGRTIVGDGCYVMTHAHIAHDCVVGDGVTIANAVQLGGHCWIDEDANVGLAAVVHQRLAIGAGAMVGMQSAVRRHVPPFGLVLGNPARLVDLNAVGLRRRGVPDEGHALVSRAIRNGDYEDLPPDLRGAFSRFAERSMEG